MQALHINQTRSLFGFFRVGILLVLGLTFAIQAQYGSLKGRVVESTSQGELTGANIYIESLNIGATTDSKGAYYLAGIPVGEHTVQITYLGYETASAAVTIRAGQTTEQDFQMKETVLEGQDVLTWGVRAKGQAAALTQQKNAANIKNIVAADQMGRFPDANASEAVQRVPGVALERDLGEGRYIQIRGGSARMTTVTFNGERIPSPEDSRQIAIDAVPVDILESIEVVKAITPDMDADAIGGSVNLVTKKAPYERQLNVEASGGYGSIREDISGNGSFTFGTRTNDGKLGFLLSGSASRRNFGADDLEPEYDLGDSDSPDDDELTELQVRHYTLWRARLGATGVVDYKFNERSGIYFSGVYSELQDDEQRRRLRNIVEDDELVFEHKSRRENLRTLNGSLGGDYNFQNGSKLDYHVTYTASEEDTPTDTEVVFAQGDVTFSPSISDPDNIRANPAAGAINGAYEFDELAPASSLVENKDFVAALNVTIPVKFGEQSVMQLKAGGKFRSKDKNQDVVEEEFGLADTAEDILLSQFSESIDFSGFNPGDFRFPNGVTTQEDVDGLRDRFASSLEGERLIEEDVNDFNVKEATMAGYLMGEINLTPNLLFLPGLRFERTSLSSDGFEWDSEAETLTPKSAENDYNNFFPMAHLRYRLTPRTNVRAAFTTTISRPNFFDLVPYRLRDDEDLEIGNVDLDPTTSSNFDVMFEHYNQLIGVMSAGFFYKNLSNPIFPAVSDNDLGGETVQNQNGESGTITGVEVALQQQLKFLPGALNGLGFYGNYTLASSDLTLPTGREARLAGQSDNILNLAVSYEKAGFSTQLSLNYQDSFIQELGETELEDVFADTRLQLDISATYQIMPSISTFFELINLTNEPFVLYQGIAERPIQQEFYEVWGRIGLRMNL